MLAADVACQARAQRHRRVRCASSVGALTGLVAVSLLAGLWFAQGYDVDECKVRVAEENRVRFEALKQQKLAEAKAKREASGESAEAAVEANQAGRQYQNTLCTHQPWPTGRFRCRDRDRRLAQRPQWRPTRQGASIRTSLHPPTLANR